MITGDSECADVADLSFIAAGLSHFEGLDLLGRERLAVRVHRRAKSAQHACQAEASKKVSEWAEAALTGGAAAAFRWVNDDLPVI